MIFLWDFLKQEVYKTRLHTVQEMKHSITVEIENIPPEMLQNVMTSTRRRAEFCLKTMEAI
ncbi:hypothetical protein C0J52_17929 [Blattella germanica]|nr:hypothetical protein C0J52_17929 [Blattella germanica]